MTHYGIIGFPLGHSYSEGYFTNMFSQEGIDAQYTPYPIQHISEVTTLLSRLDGFNVTYPYKESILPYLTKLDTVASEIGAVNVVHKGKGYNTDWIGFRDSLRPLLSPNDTHALLLGTGGVSKAIQYALKDLGIQYTLVSRTPTADAIGYEQVDKKLIQEHQIIVNCTPLGMSPYNNELPNIPYQYLSPDHLLYDCIYNPAMTLFLHQAQQQGCRIKNGLEMLHLQADKAWDIWNTN